MVDVWATGITLYMMLLGHVPFWAESITDIYDKIQVIVRGALRVTEGLGPGTAVDCCCNALRVGELVGCSPSGCAVEP